MSATLFGLTSLAHGFSSGAVDCILIPQNMAQFHGASSSGSPYQLTAPTSYVPNVPIQITLSSNSSSSYKGLLLSAATAAAGTQVNVGSWTPPSDYAQMSGCNGASLTSTLPTLKSPPLNVTFVPSPLASESIRLSGAVVASLSQWFALNSVTITRTPKVLNLDADASGNPITQEQGLILLRHLLGFSGSALIEGINHPQATRTTAQISQYITTNLRAFDVDGDNVVRPNTDALLIVRYLNGMRGAALLAGAAQGTLLPAEIEARIANLIAP